MVRTSSIVLAAVLAAACAPPKPPPPVVVVAPSADTVIVPVVSISSGVPLSDGRWVVLAPEEFAVDIVDFGHRRVDPFPGITKAEIPGPTTLIGIGDTIIVGDWGLRRFTAWKAGSGRLAAWPAPDALHGAFPHARDAAGQWYFAVAPPARPGGTELLDSTVIVRADPQLTRFDTLARLAPPDLAAIDTPDGRQYRRRLLGGEDSWGVEADGTLWIARVFQNQLELHPPNRAQVTRSDPLPDMVLAVSQMDRQIFIRRFPEDQRDAAGQLPFAAVKPPFERVFAAADGRFWLFKSDTALAPVRTFQVADAHGVLLYVSVPSRGSALGMSDDDILMGEEFPGGIRLIRYPIPAEAKAKPAAP